MAYDFNQAFGERTGDTSGNIFIQTTNVRMLHGLFGPRLELGHGGVRPFVMVKGGFERYFLSSCQVAFGCVASQIANLRADHVNGVLYPGGGIEGQLGPVGLRVEAGDEICFNPGGHNNLRVGFGEEERGQRKRSVGVTFSDEGTMMLRFATFHSMRSRRVW